jgi:hypothetical protein
VNEFGLVSINFALLIAGPFGGKINSLQNEHDLLVKEVHNASSSNFLFYY